MPPYIDTATGEVYESCPRCEAAEAAADVQISAMERERRADRAARTKAENALEAAEVGKRDKATWEDILGCWLLAFPAKRPSAKGIKSARATAVFQRLERGATVEDVKDAIAGSMALPYTVYGRRVASGSRTDDATDLADIVSISSDRNFDELRELGHTMRNPEGAV